MVDRAEPAGEEVRGGMVAEPAGEKVRGGVVGRAGPAAGLAALAAARQRSNGSHRSHHRRTQPGRSSDPACSTFPPCRSAHRSPSPPAKSTPTSTLRLR